MAKKNSLLSTAAASLANFLLGPAAVFFLGFSLSPSSLTSAAVDGKACCVEPALGGVCGIVEAICLLLVWLRASVTAWF